MADKKTVPGWILTVMIAVIFLAQAGMKFMMLDFVTEMLNETLNVPIWAIPVIGAIELVGAVLVLIPKTRIYGASVLMLVMIGALGTHFLNADWMGAAMPMMVGILVGIVMYLHRDEFPLAKKAAGQGTAGSG